MTSISSYGTRSLAQMGGNPDWVHARFDRAVDIVQSLPRSGPIQTNYDDKLLLYSCYKQATEGDIKTQRPGLLDVLGRAKWDAWNKRKGMTQEEAERMYVNGLLKILKGYSDRTQAVELIRELETFSLDPRAMVMSGSLAPSESSSSSTEGDGGRSAARSGRPQPLPAPSTSRRRDHALSAHAGSRRAPSQRSRPAAASARHAPPSTTSASVAPSLPGYGPPRTRADSPRRPGSSSDSGTGSEDSYSSAEEDQHHQQQYQGPSRDSDRHYANSQLRGARQPPPTTMLQPPFQPHPPQQQQQYQQQRRGSAQGQSSLPPPSPRLQHHHSMPDARILSPPPHPATQLQQQQPQHQGPPSLPFSPYVSHLQPQQYHTPRGGVTGFEPPSPASVGGGPSASRQAVAMALTPGQQAGLVHPPAQISAAPIRAQTPTPGLDAALDRIQTSLTALHERLAEVERARLPSLATSSGGGGGGGNLSSGTGGALGSGSSSSVGGAAAINLGMTSTMTLVRLTFVRVLVLLRLRAPERTPQALLRVSVWRLVVGLIRAGLKSVRRAMGQVGAVLLVVGLIGRLTGRSQGVENVAERVVAGLIGGQLWPAASGSGSGSGNGLLNRGRLGAGRSGNVLQ